MNGEVIGVNSVIYSPSGGSVGIAFAIPADTVKSVVSQLKENGSVTRGWIGVQIQPVTKDIADSLGMKEASGALVAQPQDGSPAEKAGIVAGDVITAVNGEEVKDARDLAKKIGAMNPKSEVKLSILHKGEKKTVNLTLGTMPSMKEARANSHKESGQDENAEVGKLGLRLAPATEMAGGGDQGVVVTAVDPDGVAAGHGISTGDVILEVGGKTVSSPSDVRKVIASARSDGKRAVLMRVKSGDNTKFVALPMGRG
jgi:serine protease Do